MSAGVIVSVGWVSASWIVASYTRSWSGTTNACAVDGPRLERGGHRDDLVHRARLVHVGDRAAPQVVGVRLGEAVGVEPGVCGHREDLPRLRVHHDDGSPGRVVSPHGVGQRLLSAVLDVPVDGQDQVVAGDGGVDTVPACGIRVPLCGPPARSRVRRVPRAASDTASPAPRGRSRRRRRTRGPAARGFPPGR